MGVLRSPEPAPRRRPLAYRRFALPRASVYYLPLPRRLPKRSFFPVLLGRRSAREFGAVNEGHLSTLLWYSARTHEIRKREKGPEWRHKCTPSAGGCHPIEVLLVGPSDSAWPTHFYDDNAHALCGLPLSSGETAESLRRKIAAILDPGGGTVLLFAADYRRTSSLYRFADSLLWRDAGALLATVILIAQALDLNCCALGFTGDFLIKRLLGGNAFVGMGGCIIGSKPGKPAQAAVTQ